MLSIILLTFLILSSIAWFISHAPIKKNKTEIMSKVRKWSTLLLLMPGMATVIIKRADLNAVMYFTIAMVFIILFHLVLDRLLRK